MRNVIVMVLVALVSGCGGRAGDSSPRLPAASGARKHIENIDKMNLEQLSEWVRTCAPYNSSLEARARNPYDPVDCDEVQWAHDSWHRPRTNTARVALPAIH